MWGPGLWHLDVDVAPEELPVHYRYALTGGPANDILESGADRVADAGGWLGLGAATDGAAG